MSLIILVYLITGYFIGYYFGEIKGIERIYEKFIQELRKKERKGK